MNHEGTKTQRQVGQMLRETDTASWETVERERAATAIVDAAYRVHSALGPGLLESVYERCLAYEFKRRGIEFQSQVCLPIKYDGVVIGSGLRVDLLVARRVIIELKAVERLQPIHVAQLLTYLKLTDLHLGLLINFNVPVIRDGIRRVIR